MRRLCHFDTENTKIMHLHWSEWPWSGGALADALGLSTTPLDAAQATCTMPLHCSYAGHDDKGVVHRVGSVSRV